ncbi:hypothetical protein LUZ60_001817 [Juncus effusus]|nr:hypothetical protein LUZ60_001817 [Juncus effusus]
MTTPNSETQAPPSKDPAWAHCCRPDPKISARVQCNYCKNVYTGGITRMKEHLAGITGNAVSCTVVPDEVRKKIFNLVQEQKRKIEEKTKLNKETQDSVNLDHPNGGDETDDEDDNEGLRNLRASGSSKGTVGPMDLFCKLSEEEIEKKGKKVKVQSALTTKLKKRKKSTRK